LFRSKRSRTLGSKRTLRVQFAWIEFLRPKSLRADATNQPRELREFTIGDRNSSKPSRPDPLSSEHCCFQELTREKGAQGTSMVISAAKPTMLPGNPPARALRRSVFSSGADGKM